MAEKINLPEFGILETMSIERPEISKEISEEENKRSRFNKFIGSTICALIGHSRYFSVWKGKYNPRYCKRCHKHIRLWWIKSKKYFFLKHI